MPHSFSFSTYDYPFNDYFNEYEISDTTKNKLNEADILVLPTPYENSKYYFAQEAVNFVKYCRAINKNIKTDILADSEKIEVRSLHSFDIWMPIIWIASNIDLPIAINLVSNYIYDRMKGRENEECTVKLSIVSKNKDNFKELHYDGDAKTFKEKFEKIDLNSFWGD